MTKPDRELFDSDPITLTEASQVVLRGVVSVSALRAEIRRGNLAVERGSQREGRQWAGNDEGENSRAEVVRQAETLEEALRGL